MNMDIELLLSDILINTEAFKRDGEAEGFNANEVSVMAIAALTRAIVANLKGTQLAAHDVPEVICNNLGLGFTISKLH